MTFSKCSRCEHWYSRRLPSQRQCSILVEAPARNSRCHFRSSHGHRSNRFLVNTYTVEKTWTDLRHCHCHDDLTSVMNEVEAVEILMTEWIGANKGAKEAPRQSPQHLTNLSSLAQPPAKPFPGLQCNPFRLQLFGYLPNIFWLLKHFLLFDSSFALSRLSACSPTTFRRLLASCDTPSNPSHQQRPIASGSSAVLPL